jgi:hypothetical protein
MRTTSLIALLVAGLAGPQLAAAGSVPKRPLPSYDGRPAPEADLAETLVWVPRVVLFPAHLVAEYGLRRPVVGAVTWGEEHYIAQRARRIFTSDDGKRGVYPYFLVDSGLRPRLGAVAFAESFLHADNDLRLSGTVARTDVYSVSAKDRLVLGGSRRTVLMVRGSYSSADDNRFYGLGPMSAAGEEALFSRRQGEASVALERNLRGLSRATTFVRLRDARFGGSQYSGAARDLAATHGGPGQPELPPGWQGYQLLGAGASLVLDSRSPSTTQPSPLGVRVEADGAFSVDPRDSRLRFGEWGGEVAGFVDVSGHDNVFGARVAARFQENAGSAAIPFAERIALGGSETMRGFLAGRMRGDSAFLAEVQYRYAIWSFADAELFSGVGNTFEGHLQGLRPSTLFWNSGLSLRTTFSRDSSWAVGVAMGSTRFDAADFAVADHVRLFAGLNQGF